MIHLPRLASGDGEAYIMNTRSGELSFVRVHDAPYKAIVCQPEACLDTVGRWTEVSL